MALRARELLRIAAVAAVAVLFALAIARTSWHRALENAYYDWWHVLAGVRYAPKHTAVVTVDERIGKSIRHRPRGVS